mmetsp:Transcript_22669/g.64179  ORF Transcript_22669/g.64179 Transcript_22669/m.64179 type:complete len:80 (-) Transcript_22669:595-834(-)
MITLVLHLQRRKRRIRRSARGNGGGRRRQFRLLLHNNGLQLMLKSSSDVSTIAIFIFIASSNSLFPQSQSYPQSIFLER